jgi:aminocarboxymuconate-semialdehyde decarboxylase
MKVDFHAHFVPPECATMEFPVAGNDSTRTGWAWDRQAGTVSIGGRLRSMPGAVDAPWFGELSAGTLTDIDYRVEWMDSVGLDVQVISPPPYLCLYDAPLNEGWRSARALNEGIARARDAHPERIAGFATVPLQDPGLAARELEYAVNELRLSGAQILTNVHGADLDEVQFISFWEAVAALDVPIFLHPHLPTDRKRMSHHYMVNAVGNPHETALATAHLIFGGIVDRYPNLRFILSHNGGAVPATWGRWRHTARVIPEARVRRENFDDYLQHFFFDGISHDADGLARSVRLAGAHNVVLGTDYPYDMGELTPIASLEKVDGLTADEVSVIAAGAGVRARLPMTQPNQAPDMTPPASAPQGTHESEERV